MKLQPPNTLTRPGPNMEDTTPGSGPAEGPGHPGRRGTVGAPGAIELLTLGIAAAVTLAAGGRGLGYLVDGWAGTSPIFTLVGLAGGIVAAVLLTVTGSGSTCEAGPDPAAAGSGREA